MKNQFRRKSPTRQRQLNPSRLYEYYKIMWQAAHPDATHQEYEDAIRRIARELRI